MIQRKGEKKQLSNLHNPIAPIEGGKNQHVFTDVTEGGKTNRRWTELFFPQQSRVSCQRLPASPFFLSFLSFFFNVAVNSIELQQLTSNPMQVPTSQQKEGIYDVPKRHFMTVGVFLFVCFCSFVYFCMICFLSSAPACKPLAAVFSRGEAVKVSHPLRPPTDVYSCFDLKSSIPKSPKSNSLSR